MKDPSSIHQMTYIISIQSEYHRSGPPIFRGTLCTVSGQEFKFSTLAELEGLLCEICGWVDMPGATKMSPEST